MTKTPDIATTAADIFARFDRGEPVTQQMIDDLPRDVRVACDAIVTTTSGKRVPVVIEIFGGAVTVRPVDRNDAPGTPIQ